MAVNANFLPRVTKDTPISLFSFDRFTTTYPQEPMFQILDPYIRNWIIRRRTQVCRYCYASDPDPVNLMCKKCWGHWRRNGSPIIKFPSLKAELDQAAGILSTHDMVAATEAFHGWMVGYARQHTREPLRRLCWLHFVHLRAEDGLSLVRLQDMLRQCLAVSLYDKRGGRVDNGRNQYRYMLGRACVTIIGKRRQVADGTRYNIGERRRLQRTPQLFHRAYEDIFLRAGISKVLAKVLDSHNLKSITM